MKMGLYCNILRYQVVSIMLDITDMYLLIFIMTDITEIDKSQAKLLKSAIGLHTYYRNSPLLNAMNVDKIPKLALWGLGT